MTPRERVVALARDALITAETMFREDQVRTYRRAILRESHDGSRWVLETLLENARIAAAKTFPLCDDTGIPHLFVEVGSQVCLTGDLLSAIREGVAAGQRALPTRLMGVLGSDPERLSQSGGLSEE